MPLTPSAATSPEFEPPAVSAKPAEFAATSPQAEASPKRLAELAGLLAVAMDESIAEIRAINQQARVLSLNAQIEAARAGDSNGAAFGVVARHGQRV